MRKFTCILAFLMVQTITAGQSGEKERLLQLAANGRQDTSAVSVYLDLINFCEDSEPAKALEYSHQAELLSRKINFSTGIIRALRARANVFAIMGTYDSTLFYYRKCLELSLEINDSLNIGMSLLNIGSAYRRMSDYQSALNYSLQAVNILESIGDKASLGKMNNSLQLLYYYLPNYQMAIVYGEKAVQQARELKDKNLLVMALSNLSMSFKDLHQFDKAKKALTEAHQLAKENGDLNSESAILINLGGVYLEQGEYALLQENAQKALLISRRIQSKDAECISLRALAISYLQQGQYHTAKNYARLAYAIADSNDFKLEKSNCLKTLSNISYALQELKEGEMYFNKSDDLSEAIFKEEYMKSAAEFEKKYEVEKKDKQIILQQAQLQKRRIYNYVLIIAAIALLCITLLYYRYYRQKQKLHAKRISELEKEKQLAATEALLKGEEQERSRMAKDLHDGLGGMLSGIKFSLQTLNQNQRLNSEDQQAFERSLGMLDRSISEMRRIAHNMMPEALVLFGLDAALKDFCSNVSRSGSLEVNYHSIGMEDSSIEQSTAIAIYRIVQELVNNTMKHASARNAVVQLSKNKGRIDITVEDDGKGFDPVILKAMGGMGWNNIRSRVSYLNGSLDLWSEEGKGTSVHIELCV